MFHLCLPPDYIPVKPYDPIKRLLAINQCTFWPHDFNRVRDFMQKHYFCICVCENCLDKNTNNWCVLKVSSCSVLVLISVVTLFFDGPLSVCLTKTETPSKTECPTFLPKICEFFWGLLILMFTWLWYKLCFIMQIDK